MNQKKKSPAHQQLGDPKTKIDNITASAQRKRLLAYLRQKGSLSTFEAREKLNIMHPGGRICELRQLGYNIKTVWVHEVDSCDRLHRVGQYFLSSSDRHGGQKYV